MDLFTPIIPKELWHHNFKSILESGNGFNCDVINDWARGFEDRDGKGKFVKEWQKSFNSCFWELYLHAVLRKYRFEVDWSNSTPDFHIVNPVEFILEETISSNEKEGLPEHETFQVPPPAELNEFNRKTIIRLSNSIHSKYKKYKDKYELLPHVHQKPFILAVSAFDRPYFNMTCQRAIEALLYEYYVDEEQYLAVGDKNIPLEGVPIEEISKDNGASIEMGLFTKGVMSEISAVIFSSCATWGKVRALSSDPNPNVRFTALRQNMESHKPHIIKESGQRYGETLLDGLRVYHNPAANYPISPEMFRRKEVFQSYYDFEEDDWVYEQCDGQLLFRTVFTEL